MARGDKATFPTRLLAPLLVRAIEEHDDWCIARTPKRTKPIAAGTGKDNDTHFTTAVWGGGLQQVEDITGIPARRIFGVIRQETANVTHDLADRILVGLGLLHLTHIPVAEGGLQEHFDDFEGLLADPETPEQTVWRTQTSAGRLARKKAVA